MSVGVKERLLKLRKRSGKSQGEIADYLNMSQTAYGKIELGKRGLNVETCLALADLYGVTCDYILRGVEADSVDAQRVTHLSGRAIHSLQHTTGGYTIALDVISEMLSDEEFMKGFNTDIKNALKIKQIDEEAFTAGLCVSMVSVTWAEFWKRLLSSVFFDDIEIHDEAVWKGFQAFKEWAQRRAESEASPDQPPK